jgi:hypothetical protein
LWGSRESACHTLLSGAPHCLPANAHLLDYLVA